MPVVVIAKTKGGVGASTTCRELAVAAVQDGARVGLITLDAGNTLGRWWSRRTDGVEGEVNPQMLAVEMSVEGIADALRDAAQDYDLLLVDTPPSTHPVVGRALEAADLVLVPTGATQDDIDELATVMDTVGASDKPFAFVLTLTASGASVMRDRALRMLGKHGRIGGVLPRLNAFPEAAEVGGAAVERKGKAAEAVQDLWGFVREQAKVGKPRRKAGTQARKRSGSPESVKG